MQNEEAIRRLAKVQGRLMKLIADLENLKMMLRGAYAPQLDQQEEKDAQRMIKIFTDKRRQVKKNGSLSCSGKSGVQPETNR